MSPALEVDVESGEPDDSLIGIPLDPQVRSTPEEPEET